MKIIKKLQKTVMLELGVARGAIQTKQMNDIVNILESHWDTTTKRNEYNWFIEDGSTILTGSTLMQIKCERYPEAAHEVVNYIFDNDIPVMFHINSLLRSSFVNN
jgi:hypothetical protein